MKQKGALATLWRFIRPESEELVAYLLIIFIMLGYAGYSVAMRSDGEGSFYLVSGSLLAL